MSEADAVQSAKAFVDKVIVITGAASGLGAECARQFAAEGANLILVDRDEARSQELAASLSPISQTDLVIGDVADSETAEAAVLAAQKRFGRLDVLVNNAGIDPLSATTVTNTTEAQWDAVMNVNVKAAFLFSRAALPLLQEGRRGSIVNVASVSGLTPSPKEAVYSVSKGALVQLTKSIALDYAGSGVRANCICPGFMEAIMRDRLAELPKDAVVNRSGAAAEMVPMGREGRYDEIARAVLFLADETQSSYITGSALVIDGGYTLA